MQRRAASKIAASLQYAHQLWRIEIRQSPRLSMATCFLALSRAYDIRFDMYKMPAPARRAHQCTVPTASLADAVDWLKLLAVGIGGISTSISSLATRIGVVAKLFIVGINRRRYSLLCERAAPPHLYYFHAWIAHITGPVLLRRRRRHSWRQGVALCDA